MTQTYWLAMGVGLGVVLTVLFVPGVGEYIERALLGWAGRWAR